MIALPSPSVALFPAFFAVNLGVLVPLSLSCLVIVVVIPSAAWRGRLSVPLYALMMFASAFVAFGVGRVAGWQSVRGTTLGVVVSFIFFLFVAGAAGSFLGIFFYRHPSGESVAGAHDQDISSAVPALDEDHR